MKKYIKGPVILGTLIVCAIPFLNTLWNKRNSGKEALASADSFRSNICWVDHAYIFSIKFQTNDLPVFEFIKDENGKFIPYDDEKEIPSHATGNGFMIDSLGACIIPQSLYTPWNNITPAEFAVLDALAREFRAKYNAPDLKYEIRGQSLGIFVFLAGKEEFISYRSVSEDHETEFITIFPSEPVLLEGVAKYTINGNLETTKENQVAILNMNPSGSEENVQMSVSAVSTSLNFVENTGKTEVLFGDAVSDLSPGALVVAEKGVYGQLQFKSGKWILHAFSDPITYNYQEKEFAQIWKYENAMWKQIFRKEKPVVTEKPAFEEGEYLKDKGPLESSFDIIPAPVVK
jgi:hypothetical protein